MRMKKMRSSNWSVLFHGLIAQTFFNMAFIKRSLTIDVYRFSTSVATRGQLCLLFVRSLWNVLSIQIKPFNVEIR